MLEAGLAVLGVIGSVVGFYVKQLYGRLEKLETTFQSHLVDDAAKYLPRSEMNEFANRIRLDVQAAMQPIAAKLQSIEEHLRKKE